MTPYGVLTKLILFINVKELLKIKWVRKKILKQ